MLTKKVSFIILATCIGLLSSCPRTYHGDGSLSGEFLPVEVVVPEQISTTSATKITFSECIFADWLAVTLFKADNEKEVSVKITPGPPSEEGCVTEVTFTPESQLQNDSQYILDVDAPAFSYSFTVMAISVFEFKPGVYLMVNGGGPLDKFSEKLRTWFVEFDKPDADGYFDIWHVDADAPGEQDLDPVCMGWSAQPNSDVGKGIGWFTHTRGVLNEDGDSFSTPEGEVMDIEVKPLVCLRGGRYEGVAIPMGDTISGTLQVQRLEIPCSLASPARQALYNGNRCPEGTVLPHE